jgi:hypothetical protein
MDDELVVLEAPPVPGVFASSPPHPTGTPTAKTSAAATPRCALVMVASAVINGHVQVRVSNASGARTLSGR